MYDGEIVICSKASAVSPEDDGLKSTVIHELTHIYQKKISDKNIKAGRNMINNSNHVLYKYYDLLFNVNNNKWNLDTVIANSKNTSSCTNYGNIYTSALPTSQIFVSWYNCIQSTVGENGNVLPEEEMAESVTAFYFDKDTSRVRLQNQDIYNYINLSGVTVSGDIGRSTFIQNNFK